tara:strand:+ start:22202 stop:22765 length:564 start_codon:yes stop_codon:yes gene_type:complete
MEIIFVFCTALFVVWFIVWSKRDPERSIPKKGVVSPADGKISIIREDVNGKVRVGVFMNVYDVHVNRAPMPGYVKKIDHLPGRYVPAFSKDSDRNERVRIVFTSLDLSKKIDDEVEEWEVVLIAGALARRIKPYVKVGDYIEKGERIGHIEFGSRVDVIFPTGVRLGDLMVKKGDRVRAGESTLLGD